MVVVIGRAVRCDAVVVLVGLFDLAFESFVHQHHDELELIFVQSVENVLASLVLDRVSAVRMRQLDLLAEVHDSLIVELGVIARFVAVLDADEIDLGFVVGAGQNDTDFTDVSVNNPVLLLDDHVVGENGEGIEILVANQLRHVLAGVGVVQISVSIHTPVIVLQDGMPNDLLLIGVDVLKDKRDLVLVHVREGSRRDHQSVRAPTIRHGCVTTEVVVLHGVSFHVVAFSAWDGGPDSERSGALV